MATNTSKFVGKWKLVGGAEGTEEIVIGKDGESDVNFVLVINVNDEHWKIAGDGIDECKELDLGKEFDAVVDTRKMKSTFRVEGSKLIGDYKKVDPEDENMKSEWYPYTLKRWSGSVG
ncbi:hypothetical protein AAVH_16549 [Aphelenchoides avenae]|nr:hypothetical protein AAVH_16549 [Aphelenchus avenae]